MPIMVRSFLPAVVLVAMPLLSLPAVAQQPVNLLPPAPPVQDQEAPAQQVPADDKPLLEEASPSFQPVRPADDGAQAEVDTTPARPEPPMAQARPESVPAQPPAMVPPAPAGLPVAPPAVAVAVPPASDVLPTWAAGLLVLFGAFLAGLFGMLTVMQARRGELRERRRSVAVALATELETRKLAFDAVPLPPNAEAGVSFVSSVTSLAGVDAAFRAMQGQIHVLPDKLAAHVSVHYAAMQRVSDFVKGQSLAAAVRMLQANRLGGHPCPDAGAMREAHVELGMAFRGVDKLAQALRALC